MPNADISAYEHCWTSPLSLESDKSDISIVPITLHFRETGESNIPPSGKQGMPMAIVWNIGILIYHGQVNPPP
jgi:hypothetical protein